MDNFYPCFFLHDLLHFKHEYKIYKRQNIVSVTEFVNCMGGGSHKKNPFNSRERKIFDT